MTLPDYTDPYCWWLLLALHDRDEELAVQHARDTVPNLTEDLEQDVRRAARGEYDEESLRRAYLASLPSKACDLPDYQREDWSPK